jgi:hypothetical protein
MEEDGGMIRKRARKKGTTAQIHASLGPVACAMTWLSLMLLRQHPEGQDASLSSQHPHFPTFLPL